MNNVFNSSLHALVCLGIETYNGTMIFLQFLQIFMPWFIIHLKSKIIYVSVHKKLVSKPKTWLNFQKCHWSFHVWSRVSRKPVPKEFYASLKIESRPYPLLRAQNHKPFHCSSSSPLHFVPSSLSLGNDDHHGAAIPANSSAATAPTIRCGAFFPISGHCRASISRKG